MSSGASPTPADHARQKVGSAPLSEIAFNKIRDDIVTCRLAPGQKVTERGLVDELRISIAAVRNAVTRLDQEGLLITQPRKGYIVAPLSLHSINMLFDFWALLGPELALRGIPVLNDQQMGELLDCSALLDAHVDPDDEEATRRNLVGAVDASLRMFAVMAEASANPYLVDAYRRVSGELSRVWRLVIQSEFDELGGRESTLTDIVSLLEARDAHSAAEFLRTHIEASRQRVLSTLARWPSVSMSEIRAS